MSCINPIAALGEESQPEATLAKDVLNIEVEPGETYYIQGSISIGIMVGRPNLAPSDEATFNAVKGKLKDSGAPKAGK